VGHKVQGKSVQRKKVNDWSTNTLGENILFFVDFGRGGRRSQKSRGKKGGGATKPQSSLLKSPV